MLQYAFTAIVFLTMALDTSSAGENKSLPEPRKAETLQIEVDRRGGTHNSNNGDWSYRLPGSGEFSEGVVSPVGLSEERGRGVYPYSSFTAGAIRAFSKSSPGTAERERIESFDPLRTPERDIEAGKLDDTELGAINGRALLLHPSPGKERKVADIILWDEVKTKMIQGNTVQQQLQGPNIFSNIVTIGATTQQRR